jgi:phosphatidylinositol glycan class W
VLATSQLLGSHPACPALQPASCPAGAPLPYDPPPPARLRRAAGALRSSAVVAALGLARLLTTRAVDYQQHVSEYGVHWNFFITLAALVALTALLPPPPRLLLPAGVAVLALHQAALSLCGLGAWVHSEARGPGWVSLNKEGIGSLWGYWAISLLSAAAGQHLRASSAALAGRARRAPAKRGGGGSGSSPGAGAPGGGNGSARAASQELWMWVAQQVLLLAALWAAVWVAEAVVEPVSRRCAARPGRGPGPSAKGRAGAWLQRRGPRTRLLMPQPLLRRRTAAPLSAWGRARLRHAPPA